MNLHGQLELLSNLQTGIGRQMYGIHKIKRKS